MNTVWLRQHGGGVVIRWELGTVVQDNFDLKCPFEHKSYKNKHEKHGQRQGIPWYGTDKMLFHSFTLSVQLQSRP